MKNLIIIGGLCILAILVGAYLYFAPSHQGGATEQPASASDTVPVAQPMSVTKLGGGTTASGQKTRKNYAIYDPQEFAVFWKEAAGDAPLPKVDFTKAYVIAVFAGDEPTGGYGIAVTSVSDSGDARNVAVTITVPGKDCVVSEAKTSPYEFVSVPSTGPFALAHTDTMATKSCK